MQGVRHGILQRIPNFTKRNDIHRRQLFTGTTRPQSSAAKAGLLTTAFVLTTGLFAFYYHDSRSAFHRYLVAPALRFFFDAEGGHKIAIKILRSGLGPRDPVADDICLKSEIWDWEVSNPIGLAAGFDKDGEAIDGLFNLGFSWVEIGSVTPLPQTGNPRPRVFHLSEDSAIINRYGFPSKGHASVLSHLRSRIPTFYRPDNAALRPESVLAVNLGKNKGSPEDSIEDFVQGVRTFGPYSDVLVINISSPNTPGLRGLQHKQHLEVLLKGVTKARDELSLSALTCKRTKLLLKIAPDLDESEIINMARTIRESNIDGVIVSNTTTHRPKHLISSNRNESGGLSGSPLKDYSLKVLRTLRSQLPASVPIIGCGGVVTGDDALDFARAGASLVQVYTGFGYDGVGFCRRIKDELAAQLKSEGTTWSQVVRKAVEERSFRLNIAATNSDFDVGDSVRQLTSEANCLLETLTELENKMDREREVNL